jgi:hypothetical protein
MQPTAEQDDALGLFAAGRSLALEAGAGTGKTTTLKLMAASTDARGVYLAFNRAIVEEAKRVMPRNVTPQTVHSLAFRSAGKPLAHRLGAPRMRSHELATRLGVDPITIHYGSQRKVLQPGFLAGHVMRAVKAFCFSAAPAPEAKHVAYIDGIDLPRADGSRTYDNNREVANALLPALVKAWADLTRFDGQLPFSHDVYLKVWQLSNPTIPGSFLQIDEAQDVAPVMLAAVAHQAAAGTQLVWVGDSQQQIYEWRGAVNAMAQVPADDRRYLTQSFRFGPAIADVANCLLATLRADLRLTGNPAVASRLAPLPAPVAILCRTNARAVEEMLAALAAGRRPHLLGGGAEVLAFARAASALKRGQPTSYPDLACFATWGEVQDYVAQDPQGGDLKMLVDLMDRYDVDTITSALERQPSEQTADLTISTAHKAKGREWATVRLAGDFPEEPDPGQPGDLRLAYVAATRAARTLDCQHVGMIQALLDPAAPRA